MDPHFNISDGKIEELVKTSKQLQNQIRKVLMQRDKTPPFAEYGEQAELPPIWDNVMPNLYMKNVVVDYIVDSQISQEKSVASKMPENQVKAAKSHEHIQRSNDISTITRLVETLELNEKNPKVIHRKSSATVGTQVMRNEFLPKKSMSINVRSKLTKAPYKRGVKMQNSPLKSSASDVSKLASQSNKSSIKLCNSMHRLPLQRFAETSKRNIDFSKEHPNLELDTSPNQNTLFPRRYWSDAKPMVPVKASPEKDSINLAAAKTKPPSVETWKEVLQKNRSGEKQHKVLRLKKNVEVVSHCKKIPESAIEKPKGLDIIFTPANGLFHLEKEDVRLSKPNKCNRQRFPVMYIRPERQVQKVAQISIGGESVMNDIDPAMPQFSTNVKYVECTHEEKEKEGYSPPRVETKITNDKQVQTVSSENNKFFKPLEFTKLFKYASASSDTNSKTSSKSQSKTSSSLRYSRTNSRVQESTGTPSVDISDNDIDHIVADMLSSSDGPRTPSPKDAIKMLPNRREVYVQTDDYKKTALTNPMPFPTIQPLPEPTPIIETFSSPHLPTGDCRQTSNQRDDNPIEEDFIAKIFERIRNDIPYALQAFWDRNTVPRDAEPLDSFTVKQHPEQTQRYHHQMSALSETSNVELHPPKIEARLAGVEAKRESCNESILHLPPPVDFPVTIQSPPVGAEGSKFLLLQQNALFAPTINRIKSSAVHDAMPGHGRIKEETNKYPTDVEVKRAVKIFLDSLTLDGSADDGGGGRRKSIIKADPVRKDVTLLRSELTSRGRDAKYIRSVTSSTSGSNNYSSSSSSTSDDRNIRKIATNSARYVPGSSTSSASCSSDLELESDVTVDLHRSSSGKRVASSLSEGEVLSIGEI